MTTKNIQEIAMTFLLVTTGISLILGMIWVKPVLDEQRMYLEESRLQQHQVMRAVDESGAIFTELAYVGAVLAMTESKIIPPANANKIIENSIIVISKHSDRFGRLAQEMNEFRINQKMKK